MACTIFVISSWSITPLPSIVHPEGPFQFFFRCAGAGDVYCKEELLEVDEAVLVGVEGPEDVVTELLGVAAGEKHLVHVDELDGREAAVGAVLLEALIPLLNGVLVVAGMGPEEVQVLLGQSLLALDAAHCVCVYVFFSKGQGYLSKGT